MVCCVLPSQNFVSVLYDPGHITKQGRLSVSVVDDDRGGEGSFCSSPVSFFFLVIVIIIIYFMNG